MQRGVYRFGRQGQSRGETPGNLRILFPDFPDRECNSRCDLELHRYATRQQPPFLQSAQAAPSFL